MSARPFAALVIGVLCASLLGGCAAPAQEVGTVSKEASAVEDSTQLTAYAVKVGYRNDESLDTRVFEDKRAWDEFVASMGQEVFDGEGNAQLLPIEGFAAYDEAFFEAGNTLAVAYADLPSGSLQPSVGNVGLEGTTANVTIATGSEPGTIGTTDMSGFVVVVEVPATASVRRVQL